jgi:hypothetical protein
MYRLAANVVLAEAEHGAVLLNERTGQYWLMNDTGAMALRCLLAGGSFEQAVAQLCENYRNADRSRTEHDTRKLLDKLQHAGLVVA